MKKDLVFAFTKRKWEGKKWLGIILLLLCCMNSLLAEPCGDVNSDKMINIIDALMTAQFYVGLNPQPFDRSAADVSGDSTINIIDALQIAQYYVGLITALQGCISPTTPPGNGEMLPQQGNPINTAIDNYKKYLPGNPAGDKKWGDIVVSWQFTTGAFPKSGFDHEYSQGIATEAMRAATQEGRRSLGTLDNGSTITELASLGYTYREFRDPAHKNAAQKTMNWLLETQQSTGGWQQWTPARTGSSAYSAHATFNDEAMMRVLISMQKAVRKEDPFNSDIFTQDQLNRCEAAINKGIDYILKAQIIMNGQPTVWCAQHEMQTYKPAGARAYELPSKSGQESALIASFLLSRPQTPEIARAAKAAIAWYNNPDVYVADKMYVRPSSKDGNSPFVNAPGKKMWFRFYELNTNKEYFCDRDGIPTYNIQDLSEDRYTGYVWAGSWAESLLDYAASVGMLN